MLEQIRTALASAYPITLLVSPEEDRQEKLLRRFAASAKPAELPVIVWNCVDGFIGHGGEVHRDPMKALAWIASEGPKGLYLDKLLRRGLRDTAMKIRNTGRFLFLLQQNAELPESIKPMTYVVLSMFPDDGELKALVTPLLDGKSTDGTAINRLIDSLKGMSLTEVEHLLRRLLDRHQELDDEFFSDVLDEKEQITRKERSRPAQGVGRRTQQPVFPRGPVAKPPAAEGGAVDGDLRLRKKPGHQDHCPRVEAAAVPSRHESRFCRGSGVG
jgi:hypothetical protein